jgi:thiol-disulfide isomerase/thioredoxin
MRRSIGIAFVAVLLVACTPSAAEQSGTQVRAVDEPLPVLAGEDLHGHPISSEDLLGDVLVVNAWASWCDPCAQEQPVLAAAAKRYAGQGVRFLGIDHQDQEASALDWVRSYQVPYPSLYDPSGKFAAPLRYFGLPDTYVVDRGGTIRYAIGPGAVTDEQLTSAIDALLAQTSASSATAANSPAK